MMKTSIFFLLFFTLFIVYSGFSQTQLKPQSLEKLFYGGDSINFNNQNVFAPYQQRRFYLGYQWSGTNQAINNRLHANFQHQWFWYSDYHNLYSTFIDDDTNYVSWGSLRTTNGYCWQFESQGIQFDPTANTPLNSLTPQRTNDTTGAIYGFKERRYGTIQSNGIDFNRYNLCLDSITNPADQISGKICLDKPWVDSLYTYQSDWYGMPSERIGLQRGDRWYFSINLRRTDVNDTLVNNDTIFTISLPYQLSNTDTSLIIFDSISVNTITNGYMLPNNRGFVLPLQHVTNGTNKLVITRQMLPKGNTPDSSRDVTISGYFTLKSVEDTSSANPIINNNGNDPYITKIGIAIKYHGRSNVGIDYCNVLTPFTYRLYRSEYDSIIWKLVQYNVHLCDSLAQHFNKIVRIHSFYGADEIGGQHLWGVRYYNNLFSGRFTTKGSADNIRSSFIQSSFPWEDGIYNACVGNSARPYYPMSELLNTIPNDSSKYFIASEEFGYSRYSLGDGAGASFAYDSTTYSSYETKMVDIVQYPPHVLKLSRADSNDTYYFKKWYQNLLYRYNRWGPLGSIEHKQYLLSQNHIPLLFSGRSWIAEVAFVLDWTYKGNSNPLKRTLWHAELRPGTGEEARMNIYSAIILGAKGIVYDRFYSSKLDTSIQSTTNEKIESIGVMCGDTSSTFNGLTGDTLFDSDIPGGDFLAYNDSTNFQYFMNYDSCAKYRAVKPWRLYLGRKSQRREVAKAHDFIKANESTLMNMHLVSWYAKGFETLLLGDSTTLRRIVALDTGKIRVRPTNRQLLSGEPYYEDADSTFYDITLHKLGTTSVDSTFIIATLNRRTAPFLRRSDSMRNLDTITQPTFVTTFEFDSLVKLNPTLKYAQSGAREITIPFNYRHPDTKTRLLHIQELTSDSTVKGIDTVICQSCSLSSAYLPGEGKIFRVTIQKSQDRFADRGSLDYVGQHKLIAMPNLIGVDSVNKKPIYDTSHVRYHVVFHRIDSVPGPFGTVSLPRVYYKRSKLIERCAPYDVTNPTLTGLTNLWETTLCLSDSILITQLPPDSGFVQVKEYPCKYPSLVVRFDTIDLKEYVYCVYACQKIDTLNILHIVESQFQSNTDVPQSQEIATADSSHIEKYGHPVVNASQHFNIYAYSNYLAGISYGARRPEYNQRHTFANWSDVSCYQPRGIDTNSIADCRHPSVNSYSNLFNEDDCALVWQEKNAADSTSVWGEWHVYYSRLYVDNSGFISHSLPPMKSTKNENNIDMLDGRKARISVLPLAAQGFHYFKMPSVYRMSFPNPNDTFQHSDKIIFQGDSSISCLGFSFPRTGIFVANVSSMFGNITDPDSLMSRYGGTIYSCITTLNNPSGTHAMNWYYNSQPRPFDSSFVLNFDIPEYGWLAHITQGYFNWGSEIQYIENAEHAQLAQQPFITDDYYWTFVRRVQTTPSTAINKNIFSSATELLKRSKHTEPSHYLLSGFQYGTSRFALADILSHTKESTIRSSRQNKQDRTVLRDSLASDWFSVYQSKLIQFVLADNDYDVVSMNIENKRTGIRVPIDVRSLSPQDGRKIRAGRIALRNGGGDEYRFVIGKTNEQAQYFEDVYIGDIPELLGKATTEDDYTVDVSPTLQTKESENLLVYPNPAVKEVVVRFTGLPEDITTPDFEYTLECTDALGKVLDKQLIKAKDSVTLQVENFTDGVYYIRVRGSASIVSNSFTILK